MSPSGGNQVIVSIHGISSVPIPVSYSYTIVAGAALIADLPPSRIRACQRSVYNNQVQPQTLYRSSTIVIYSVTGFGSRQCCTVSSVRIFRRCAYCAARQVRFKFHTLRGMLLPDLSFRMSFSADSVLPSATMTIGFADSDDLPASRISGICLKRHHHSSHWCSAFAVTLTCVAAVLVILNKILPFSSVVVMTVTAVVPLLSAVKNCHKRHDITGSIRYGNFHAFFASPFTGMPSRRDRPYPQFCGGAVSN